MYEPKYTITNKLLREIAEVEALRAKISSSPLLPERKIELRHRATVEKTHDSTSIEGNPLSLKQVDAALSGRLMTRHEYAVLEVRNYKKALDFISKRKRKRNPVTREDVLRLHGLAMDGLLPEAKSGAFRTGRIFIVDQDERVKYQGPPASRVPALLDALLAWLYAGADTVHPCLAAGALHYQFVSIHPFSDGNGRMARLLVMLFLGLRAFDFEEAIVLDSYYAQDKPEYHQALHECQGARYRGDADITSWLEYFTSGFLSSARILSAEISLLSLAANDIGAVKISLQDTDLLGYARQFGSLTIQEACEILQDAPRRTVQRRLRRLADHGFLTIAGDGKGTKYLWRE
jgi:Fic family protein